MFLLQIIGMFIWSRAKWRWSCRVINKNNYKSFSESFSCKHMYISKFIDRILRNGETFYEQITYIQLFYTTFKSLSTAQDFFHCWTNGPSRHDMIWQIMKGTRSHSLKCRSLESAIFKKREYLLKTLRINKKYYLLCKL